jgi:hypothetical protein
MNRAATDGDEIATEPERRECLDFKRMRRSDGNAHLDASETRSKIRVKFLKK